jgi:perosamine synthetase
VIDCIDSGWISSTGKYIPLFEDSFATACDSAHAISCSNGTVALHLALLALGIGPGDEVIVPTLTFVATANAVRYCGATPIFVDSDPTYWTMDPLAVKASLSPRTRAIIPVHLYGHPADMDAIRDIAAGSGIHVIEDAAEALGATYRGRAAGSMGDIATFSLYANKIVTSGEGGVVLTDDDDLALKIRQLKGQGQDFERRYWFPVIGYNYRMTNIQAALGLAQLEKLDWHLSRRREIASWYQSSLGGHDEFFLQPEAPWARSAHWMTTVVLGPGITMERDELMARLRAEEIETRPVFYPMHTLPPYRSDTSPRDFPVSDILSKRGLNLPTFAEMTIDQVERISSSLLSMLGIERG